MIVWIIIGLSIISVLWALISLREVLKKPHEVEKVGDELRRGRTLYQSNSSSGSA